MRPCSWVRHDHFARKNFTYQAVDLLDVVVDAQFVAFGVSRDGTVRVAAHGDLVRLDVTDLTVLVEDAE